MMIWGGGVGSEIPVSPRRRTVYTEQASPVGGGRPAGELALGPAVSATEMWFVLLPLIKSHSFPSQASAFVTLICFRLCLNL